MWMLSGMICMEDSCVMRSDYLIELAPFALVFMTTRELSYIGACEQIIIGTRCGICDLRIFRKGLGSEYLGNTSVLRGIIEVSHNEYLRFFSYQ